MKRLVSLLLIFSILSLCSCEKGSDEFSPSVSYDDIPQESEAHRPDTIKVGYTKFTGIFNPFYTSYSEDKDVVELTSVSLLTYDEDEIDNEVSENEYSGIADVNVSEGVNGHKIVTIKLKDNVMFSDGQYLDADDVIFSMYVLADPEYSGPSLFNTLPINGIEEFRNAYDDGSINNISGIEKIDQHMVRLELMSNDEHLLSKLSIFVAPLHYYGSEDKYDYKSGRFGFEKGDLSFLNEKNTAPLGAGPYEFISYEGGVVTFERNELYYNGLPNTRYVQFIEVPQDAIADSIVNGKVHFARASLTSDVIKELRRANGGVLDGTVATTVELKNYGYGYVGISADNVHVGNEKGSYSSKNLRKAFTTLISEYKYYNIISYFGNDVTIEYPVNSNSWAYPSDETQAFSTDYLGMSIYNDRMIETERYDAALNAAREYLINAGYVYDNQDERFISAPDGASLVYEIAIPPYKGASHPAYGVISDVKYALSEIGITLNIVAPNNVEEFWRGVYDGKFDMWVAGMDYNDPCPDIRQTYHSSGNKFGIFDESLDMILNDISLVSNQNIKKRQIKECFDIVADWAVEVPLYDTSDVLLIYSKGVDLDSVDNTVAAVSIIDCLPHVILNTV